VLAGVVDLLREVRAMSIDFEELERRLDERMIEEDLNEEREAEDEDEDEYRAYQRDVRAEYRFAQGY
jgi:hypothetical protein